MTSTVAGAELDVSPDFAGRLVREGVLRGAFIMQRINGRNRRVLKINGRDVQTLKQVRMKHGVRDGMVLVRALGLGKALASTPMHAKRTPR